jgi:hypothetical protein
MPPRRAPTVVESAVRVMADVAFLALTVVFFASVALLARRSDRP